MQILLRMKFVCDITLNRLKEGIAKKRTLFTPQKGVLSLELSKSPFLSRYLGNNVEVILMGLYSHLVAHESSS